MDQDREPQPMRCITLPVGSVLNGVPLERETVVFFAGGNAPPVAGVIPVGALWTPGPLLCDGVPYDPDTADTDTAEKGER